MKALFFASFILSNIIFSSSSFAQSVAPRILLTCNFTISDENGGVLAQKTNYKINSKLSNIPSALDKFYVGRYYVEFRVLGDAALRDRYNVSYTFVDGINTFSSVMAARMTARREVEVSVMNTFSDGTRFIASCLGR